MTQQSTLPPCYFVTLIQAEKLSDALKLIDNQIMQFVDASKILLLWDTSKTETRAFYDSRVGSRLQGWRQPTRQKKKRKLNGVIQMGFYFETLVWRDCDPSWSNSVSHTFIYSWRPATVSTLFATNSFSICGVVHPVQSLRQRSSE